jgi:hypothetical protein
LNGSIEQESNVNKKLMFVVLALALGLFLSAGCNLLKNVSKISIPGTVAGQVTNEGGQGQGYMSVKLCDAKSGEEIQVVTAEDTGNFFFDKVEPGEYIVKLSNTGGGDMPCDAKAFKLGPGKTQTLAIMIKSKETQAADAADGTTGGQ